MYHGPRKFYKVSRGGLPPWSSGNIGKSEKLTFLDGPKIHFQWFFALSFLHLISNKLNGVNINSFGFVVFLCVSLCSIFSKYTQPFTFSKTNVIRKLAYKVKFSQINVGLIVFSIFGNSIRFFKISSLSWLDCEQYGKNQNKKKEQNQHISVFNVLR